MPYNGFKKFEYFSQNQTQFCSKNSKFKSSLSGKILTGFKNSNHSSKAKKEISKLWIYKNLYIA